MSTDIRNENEKNSLNPYTFFHVFHALTHYRLNPLKHNFLLHSIAFVIFVFKVFKRYLAVLFIVATGK